MSGFDADPEFEIIMMPGDDEQEPTGDHQESEDYLDAQDGSDKVR